jgi:WD40 repeat protein
VYVIEGMGIVSGGADCKLAIRYFSNDLITCDFIELDHVKGVSCLTFSASKLLIAAGGWDGRYCQVFNEKCVYHSDFTNPKLQSSRIS